MADGEVKIDTKLDTSGVDKGLKDMKNKLDGAGKTIDAGAKKGKGFADNLKGISTGAVAAATGVAGVAVAVKKTVDVLNDCAAAYRVQQNAEEALQVAAKNNPYLDSESVYNLRNFASELQSLSEIGDEVSLQIMSQLAATGRNEEQIMQIMSAAADMAAVTGQDLASAAQQLNATLNGNAGLLGRQIGAINDLTKEELENGRAIELVAKQYKGVAAATADVEVQLSNAWGDFKENIGRGWQETTEPVKNFFLDLLTKINNATSATRELKNAVKDIATTENENTVKTQEENEKLVSAYQRVIEDLNAKKADAEKTLAEASERYNKKFNEITRNGQRKLSASEKQYFEETYGGAVSVATAALAAINAQIDETIDKQANAKSNLEIQKKEAAAAVDAANEKAAATARDKEATDYINANIKALQDQVKAMEIKADVAGKEVDAGEMYNAYLQSYIDLITKSNGLVSENNSAAKERLAQLQELAQKAKDAATADERLAAAQALLDAAGSAGGDTFLDKYAKRRDELNQLREDLNNNLIKFDDDEIKNAEMKNAALEELDRQYAQNKKNLWANLTSEIGNYTQQAADIAQQASDLMLQNVQTERDLELATLEEKYEKGEVSEAEYYEKQKEIKRKAAQEEYKIQMFQWTASSLAAAANIAEGVTKAIAQGGVAGIITGALVGAAGAVQLASIIASKPRPPQFAAGGIIGGAKGASMGGDNTYIHARTGEMILNAHQQRNLWDMINGQGGRGETSLDLTVNNTQANLVDTQFREEDGAVILDIVDKRVNKGFIDGTFDGGYASMLARQEGERIL